MSDETFYSSLEKAYELGYKKLNFTPTTGELLLHERWSSFIQVALNDERTESVYFYSNAILLDDEAVHKIISLENVDKISAIFFSVGGVDRESYEMMYGVNKFDIVCNNINTLCMKLKENGLKLKINCELRVPKHIKPNLKDISNKLNGVKYNGFHLDYIDSYDNIGGMINSEHLNYLPIKEKTTPCYRLNDIRFDIHGNIWACGCVVTEQAESLDLKLGSAYGSSKSILASKEKLFTQWRLKAISNACLACRFYKGI